MMNKDMIQRLKDSIETRLKEMATRNEFTDIDDMFACAQCFFDKFGIDVSEDELESIVAYASAIHGVH